MNVEKMELVGINVKNLDDAIKRFSDLFGIEFVTWHERVDSGDLKIRREKRITEHANRSFEETKIKAAIDRTGFLELVESTPPTEKEGLRNVHFKVRNLEEAKAEMERKGVRLLSDARINGLKEAVFCPDDLHGVRVALVEYDAPTLVDAVLTETA